MLNVYDSRESRRFTILEGIGKDLSHSQIASQLGVKKWIVSSDIRKMQHERDQDLRQMYQKREELINSKKNMIAQNQEKRFYRMAGMTIDEKMFQNMIYYHKLELKRVMVSKNENTEIRKLSRKVRKTLERNKIIKHGGGRYVLSRKAREFMTSK